MTMRRGTACLVRLRTVRWFAWGMVVFYLVWGVGYASAITQQQLYQEGIHYYDLNDGDACGDPSNDNSGTGDTGSATSDSTQAQKIASTFIVGLNAGDPQTAQAIATDLATKYHIGGTFLVGTSDAAKAGFTKSFYDSLGKAAGSPLVASSDEEGVVTRYNYGSVSFPSARSMAQKSDATVTQIGTNVGKVMASNGLTADLAPVLDLRDVGTGLTGRSFSSDPSVVADKAGAFAAGLKASGIHPVFKHFPGFDSTTTGSTDDQKVVMKGSIDQTVAPYKTLLAKYPDAGVMLSNMYVNALDPNNPSSMSAATVKYIRGTLNFQGLITTDDLSVSSVTTAAGSLGAAVGDALQAGVTMPLFSLGGSSVADAEANMNKIIAAVQANSAAVSAVDSTTNIIKKFKGQSTTVTVSSDCCSSDSSVLTGSDNAEKTWNFFKGKGLDDMHVAAIMGNFQQESSFNPEVIQGGGTTQDPSTVTGSTGWGIAQWTPGSKTPGIAAQLKITTPIYDLATQLNIAWGEMTTISTPAGVDGFLAKFQQQSTLADATNYFMNSFEAAGVAGPRVTDAQAALQRYGGNGASTTATGTESCAVSPDCVSASGIAKILCAAKQYDTISYVFGAGHGSAKAWHQGCPTVGPSCSLDCSGLVNIAVYDAFGVDLHEDTTSERADTTNWKQIPFSQLQPGDIIQPNPDHVEIVDHVKGQTIYTFGAHTDGVPQPQQVGPAQYTNTSGMVFMQYIGSGV